MRNRIVLACFGLILSLNLLAEDDCNLSLSLAGKNCAEEYFLAKNEKDLNSYLLNGKVKDGKLLNLEIGFNYKNNRISIASSCNVKISSGKKIVSERDGICIKAKNIEVEYNSLLLAEKKSEINLEAEKKIIIKRSELQTKGNINIVTNLFLPFDGEISVLGKSLLEADNVKISTKSNLQIDSNARIKSDEIILDGGNCEIGQEDERLAFLKVFDGMCRRFKPSFKYTGKCQSNTVSDKISISANPLANKQIVNFSIKSLPANMSVYWKFDERYSSIENNVAFKFENPGRHLAEAVVLSESGDFRKIGQYVQVDSEQVYSEQSIYYYFHNENNSNLLALIDKETYLFKNTEENPFLFNTKLKFQKKKEGKYPVVFPLSKYKGLINVEHLKIVSNADAFINQQIDIIKTLSPELSATSSSSQGFEEIINKFKLNFSNLRVEDQRQIIKFMQMYFPKKSFSEITNVKGNYNDNIFFSNAYAAGEEWPYTKSLSRKYFPLVLSTGVGVYAIPLLTKTLKEIWQQKKEQKITADQAKSLLLAAGIMMYAVYNWYKLAAEYVDNIYIPKIWEVESVDVVNASQKIPVFLSCTFGGIDIEKDFNSKFKYVAKTIEIVRNIQEPINDANFIIKNVNDFFSGVVIEEFSPLAFPVNVFTSRVDFSSMRHATLSFAEYDDTTLTSIKDDDSLSIRINAKRNQNVKILIQYVDDFLGLTLAEEKKIFVKFFQPKAVIQASFLSPMKVRFDASTSQNPSAGLNYMWSFGDGSEDFSTQSLAINHTFSKAGIFEVVLNVSTPEGVSDETKMNVHIAPVASIKYTTDKFRVTFDATSIENSQLTDVQYLWDFGDGKVVPTKNPIITHSYNDAKKYDVQLKVVSASGESLASEEVDITAPTITYFLKLNTRGTYLYYDNQDLDYGNTNNLPWGLPFPSQYIDLSSLYTNPDINMRAGDMIYLKVSGDYRYGRQGAEVNNALLGVFTDGTNFYFPGPDSDFVPIVTPKTIDKHITTDILQDFEIFADEQTALQIPAGATRIAFAVLASNPGMTNDSDGDFGVYVTIKIVRASQASISSKQNLD